MSDFGYKPPQYRLMDTKLTLSPETQAFLDRIQAEMAAKAWMDQLLAPKWEMVDFQNLGQIVPVTVSPPNPFLTTPPVPTPAPPPPPTIGPFPPDPRPGEMKDITSAIYKLPLVQGIVQRANDEAQKQLRALKADFQAMPTGEKVVAISTSVIVAAGFIAPIIANKETRLLAFDFIKGKNIPVPGVDGLTFKLLDHGGGVSVPLFVPGLKVEGSLELPGKSATTFEATVMWDVAEFVRSRSKK
jgi:hypothetical protein